MTPFHPARALSIRRIEFLFTNRLHDMVYALKTGVPVAAIDAGEGVGEGLYTADIQ